MNAPDVRNLSPTELAHRELSQAYAHFNESLFDGELPQTLMTLQRNRATQGLFSPDRFIRHDATTVHAIEINPQIFAMSTLKEVLAVVVHEMVHVYAHQHGIQGRRGYHSSGWANQMEKVGLMPSSTFKPGGKRTGERVGHYIVHGGPFDAAADGLIADGFTITWLDRVASGWAEAESVVGATQTRQLLGGSLLGKKGLLVSHSDGGDEPELAVVGTVEFAGSNPGGLEATAGAALAGETTLSDDPHRTGEGVKEQGTQVAASSAFDRLVAMGAAAQDNLDGHGHSDGPAPAIILATGSKPRQGDVPVSIELIRTDATRADEARKKRASKTCFCCPKCKLKAWAKPAARLKCVECDLDMVSALAAANDAAKGSGDAEE